MRSMIVCSGCNRYTFLQGKGLCKQCYMKPRRKKYAVTAKARFTHLKTIAKQNALEITLTLQEFEQLIKMPCYYCGYKLGKPSTQGYGLDRVNREQGYHIDNVVSCCHDCNKIKMDTLTQEETLAAVQAILKVRFPTPEKK